jgi:hypothetical protein
MKGRGVGVGLLGPLAGPRRGARAVGEGEGQDGPACLGVCFFCSVRFFLFAEMVFKTCIF